MAKGYKRGRRKNVPNLKRTDTGGFINQYGVTFTEDEKRNLVNAVNRANRKRNKMLKERAKLPRMVDGKDTGDTIGSLQFMGKESDFILAKKTKSLQRFQSKKQYESYMRTLERVNSKDYVSDRIKGYKRNYIKALDNVYGDDAKDLKMKIRMMKPEEFMKKVSQDESMEIGYIDSDGPSHPRLNKLRAIWGVKLKEDAIENI